MARKLCSDAIEITLFRLLYGKEAVQGVNIVCLSITISCRPHFLLTPYFFIFTGD